MQLMQQNVQKSRSTTLPRRSRSRIGPEVLSQPTPPSSSGAWARCGAGPSSAAGSVFRSGGARAGSACSNRVVPYTAAAPRNRNRLAIQSHRVDRERDFGCSPTFVTSNIGTFLKQGQEKSVADGEPTWHPGTGRLLPILAGP